MIGLAAWYVWAVPWFGLCVSGPLHVVRDGLMQLWLPKPLAIALFVSWVQTPPLLIGAAVYGGLRRGDRTGERELHCLACGHVLKGLTEPRCPNCGEGI